MQAVSTEKRRIGAKVAGGMVLLGLLCGAATGLAGDVVSARLQGQQEQLAQQIKQGGLNSVLAGPEAAQSRSHASGPDASPRLARLLEQHARASGNRVGLLRYRDDAAGHDDLRLVRVEAGRQAVAY